MQSLNLTDQENQHQPQRLSIFVCVPKQQLNKLISANDKIKEVIENQWIHLLIINPTNQNKVEKYIGDLKWEIVVGNSQDEKSFGLGSVIK